MPSDRDILIKVQADITNLKAGLSTVSGDLKNFRTSMSGATETASGFDRTIKAISFQTMTTGLLNIGTAAAQVYTSLSNLDRVQNQVRASMVAIERAEDQITRKTTQLAQAVEKYGRHSERAAMIQGELETATDQLTVKQERLKLAQDNVNDTYILFGTNIVNTVFGSLQTLFSLKNMLIQKSIANTIAVNNETTSIGINTAATNQNANANIQTNIQRSVGVAPLVGLTAATGANTAANVANTASQIALGTAVRMNPLMLPLTLATMAIGIGGVVLATNEMSKANKGLESSFKNVSTSVDTTGIDLFGTSVSNVDYNVKALSTSLDELKTKAENFAKVQSEYFHMTPLESLLGDPFGKGKAYTEAGIARETLERKAQMEKYLRERMGNIESELVIGKSKWSIIESGAGKLGDIKEIETMSSKILTDTKELVDMGASWNEGLERALQYHKEDLELMGLTINGMSSIVTEQERLNNAKKKGNKQDEMSLSRQKDLLREITELKKKLSPHSLAETRKNLFKSIIDTGVFPQEAMEQYLGEYTAGQIGDTPFSGYINTATKEIKANFEMALLKHKLMAYTELYREATEIGDLESAQKISDEMKKLTTGRNIVGVSGNSEVTKLMMAVTDINRDPSYTQLLSNYSTTGEFFRANAALFSQGRIQPSTKPVINKYTTAFRNTVQEQNYKQAIAMNKDYYAKIVYGGGRPKVAQEFVVARKQADAWANSQAGQEWLAAQAIMTGQGSFAYHGRAGKEAAKNLSKDDGTALYMAGLLGYSSGGSTGEMISGAKEFLADTLSSIPQTMISGIFSSVFATGAQTRASFKSAHIGMGIRTPNLMTEMNTLIRRTSGNLLNNLNTRFIAGNYGEYDATLIQVMAGSSFSHPELIDEFKSYQTKIEPILGISHGTFGSILSDSARGYAEIDDRIRYKEKLGAMSSGATVF